MIARLLPPITATVSASKSTGSVMLVLADETGSEVQLRFSDERKASGFLLALCAKLAEVYNEKIEAELEKAKNGEKMYPCDDCGELRSKDEGGTVFTVCEGCWDKAHG